MKNRFHFILLQLIIFLGLSACQGQGAAFGPIFPTPTHIGVVSRPPIPVDFETLNSDPELFLDRQIQVSGNYVPLRQESCTRQRGPQIEWYLISEGLEMNVSGYGSIVSLLPEQSFFTIEGIWRVYKGSAGCGKEQTDETVWYLDIIRIIDPNPIVAQAIPRGAVTPASQIAPTESVSEEADVPTAVPQSSVSTPDVQFTATPLPTPANTTGQLTPSPSPTVFVVATPAGETETPTATTVSSEQTDNTPSPTPTVVAAQTEEAETPTPTPTEVGGDGLGGTGSGTPNPATPVPTPNGGYAAPEATPTTEPQPTAYP